MRSARIRRWLAALALVVPAWGMIPLDREIQSERAALKYGGARVSLALRERIGQGMAIGLLAGCRGVVADFLWIQGHGFWEKKEWIPMYRNLELVTTLQPQSVTFWDLAAFHIAWNISYAVRTDPANHSEAEGIKREREWLEKGRDFLADGLRNIPNRPDLYFSMGWLYFRKFKDYCKAAEYFRQGGEFPDAPSYFDRMYGRSLEHCGELRKAYEFYRKTWLRLPTRHYSDGKDLRPLLRWRLRALESQLQIPNDQRIFPVSSARPAGNPA